MPFRSIVCRRVFKDRQPISRHHSIVEKERKMLVTVILGLLAPVLAFYVYVYRTYKYWDSIGVPSIDAKFPYGTMKPKTREHMCKTFARFYEEFKTKTPLVGMFFILRPVALLTDVSLVQKIYAADFQTFPSREFFYNEKHDPLSVHIVSVEGDRWKPMRTKLTPVFTPIKMKMLFPLINNVRNELKLAMDRMLRKSEVIEIQELMLTYTTDFISSTCFGIDSNSLRNPNSDFREIGGRALIEAQTIFKKNILKNFKSVARFLGIRAISPDISDFFSAIVKEAVKYREENKVQRKDLLEALIQIKNEVNDEKVFGVEQIAAQCFAFFVGGTETSARTLSFALYELSQPRNKHMQEMARDEINRVFSKHGDQLTSEASDELVYVDQIIKGERCFFWFPCRPR